MEHHSILLSSLLQKMHRKECVMRPRNSRGATVAPAITAKACGARLAATVSSVLSSGVFFGTVAALTPAKRRFDSRTYVTVQQATISNLRPVMGALLPASVLANLALLVTADRADPRARRNAAIGLLGPLTSLMLTARWELPINAQVMTWHPDHPPADWTTRRDRWETVHLARTATALIGLAGTLATTLSRSDRPADPRVGRHG